MTFAKLWIPAFAGTSGGRKSPHPERGGLFKQALDPLHEDGCVVAVDDAVIEAGRQVHHLADDHLAIAHNDPVGVSAAEQAALLEKVRETFRAQPFIERIEVIPNGYLRPRGGFDNLEQVARMYGVDLVALVSYDQIVRTDQNAASLLYWTLVGAYTIRGNKNQVSTFIDTSVFDVATRTLLFRAPGTDQRDAGSTAVRVDEVQGRLAGESFAAAMAQMTGNLDTAIADFAVRAREEGQVKLVDRRSGGEWRRGGGGSVRWWELALLAGAGLLLLRRR